MRECPTHGALLGGYILGSLEPAEMEEMRRHVAECPYCGSTNTSLRNAFGPTLCRMTWYCHDCRDAFEQFKAL